MSHRQTWRLSQDAGKNSGECSVCHAVRQLHLKDGTIHQHGPRHNRCPGSGKTPAISHAPTQQHSSPATATVSPPSSPVALSQSQPLFTQTQQQQVTQQPHQPIVDHPNLSGNIIKHIPRSARPHCATQLTAVIKKIAAQPDDTTAWSRLLNYGKQLLLVPPRAGRKHNVANILKKRTVDTFSTSTTAAHQPSRPPATASVDDRQALSAAVRSKLEDGNIRAAVRIICSEEKPAANNDATLKALRERHPPAAVDFAAVPDPSAFSAMSVTEREVSRAIRSFPAGSAAGPDGIRPQHLLDLITCKEAGQELVAAITELVNLLLEGRCPPAVASILFGGRLFALEKKSGGVRPIVIGYTWRRLAAKCANSYALSQLGDSLLPEQLGVATSGGCEAAVHATRRYMAAMSADTVLVKIDFSNAFNCLRRDRMLKTVADHMPDLYRFCWLSYGNATALRFRNDTIWSAEGAQQGDPLGPLLFCMTIQPLLQSLSSELVAAYLDDVTLGGSKSTVADDINTIATVGPSYGLELNTSKCEAITQTGVANHAVIGGFQQKTTDSATLLGAPLSTGAAMTDCLQTRCQDLTRAVNRLKLVSSHDALVLLKNSLSAPKLLHTLRSACCVDHDLLKGFDDQLRSGVSSICNVSLTDDQWLQASLPVRNGGLGIRSVSSLASSAFLASAAGTRQLQDRILHRAHHVSDETYDRCLEARVSTGIDLPDDSDIHRQSRLDKSVVESEYKQLLSRYTDPYHRARLLAAAAPHSGDWLHTLPISACGLHLEDNAIRVAVGLRLGCAICEAHPCPCGATVDPLGQHALSCKKNAARVQRHAWLNDLIHRALIRADTPAVKEPQGLNRTDGKRPDGLTLVPWHCGRSATWDVTVVHTLAASYIQQSATDAGSAAAAASERKSAKYSNLTSSHVFYPVAIETLGVLADEAHEFITEIGRRASQSTADPRETTFLYQRISTAIQRFNAVCLSNTFSISESPL